MGVPFIDIKRFEDGFLDKWFDKVKELSKNASFIGGAEVTNFEKRLQEYTSAKFTVSCANGTDALQLALRACGVGKGDKVLLPNSTFWATFESVVNVGADPCTVDINKDDLQMDFSEFTKAVEASRPKAAILVHLYGWSSKVLSSFRDFCKDKGIALIEDGAQCFGVKYNNEPIYQNAYIATTSFYPAKVLGAAGDGGAVFTNDEEIAKKVRTLANHGRTTHYEHGMIGWNSRMDSLQAAYVNLSMDYFPARLESRINFAKRYQKDLKALGFNAICPPDNVQENGYCNVILLSNEKRTALEQKLKEKGIGFGNIYPGAMSDQPGAKGFLVNAYGGRNSAELSKTVLNLPLFPYMKEEEYQEVLAVVKSL